MHDFRLFQVIGDLESTGYMVEKTDDPAERAYIVYHRPTNLAVGAFWEEESGWAYQPSEHSGFEGNHYSREAQTIFETRTRLVY